MKEDIIDAAGKTWQFLGRNGETELNSLTKHLKEKGEIVFQSLGWLAREDKIRYTKRGNKIFVSLIDSEMQLFNNVIQNMQQVEKETKKSKKRAKSA